MKILDKNTGEWKTIQLGGVAIDYDNLPVGSIIDYDGDEVPAGYELSEDGADGGTWIGDDTPTNAYNLWIDPSKEINSATEVVNTLNGNEINLAPSVKVVNDTVNYSKKETVIGKWIDGKPLYRRVFIGNMTDTVDQWINLQKCNLDHPQDIIKIEGTIKNTKNDKRVLSINTYETSSYKVAFSYLGNTDYLQCFVTGWTYTTFGFKYIVIMEYTKTTD